MHIPEPKDKQDVWEEFQPDYCPDRADSPARTDADETGVFTVKDELLIEGERRIVERKARFCKNCRSEVTATLMVCPECTCRPDGKPDDEAANSIGAVARILRPTVSKWLDRGGRSAAGNMRDDYRRHWRRAKQMGFTSVHDRFIDDPK